MTPVNSLISLHFPLPSITSYHHKESPVFLAIRLAVFLDSCLSVQLSLDFLGFVFLSLLNFDVSLVWSLCNFGILWSCLPVCLLFHASLFLSSCLLVLMSCLFHLSYPVRKGGVPVFSL